MLSQGYKGPSDMQSKFNRLNTFILNEKKCAYLNHRFSHQLQLTLVALARDNNYIGDLSDEIGILLKGRSLLREKQAPTARVALNNLDIKTRCGLSQQLAPIRTMKFVRDLITDHS